MTDELTSLNRKIERQKQIVFQNKDRYDASVEELNRLLQRRNEIRNSKLLEAISRSSKSYEEVLEFLRSGNPDDDEDNFES